MTTSSISIESTSCRSKEESSSNRCNDWIRTRIDTADSSATKNATDSHIPIDKAFLNSSCLGSVFLQREPLKIGLYSDDSSISSCETDNDDSDNDVTLFQKRRDRIDETSASCSCDRYFVTAPASPLSSPLVQEHVLSPSNAVKKMNIPCISSVPKFNRKPDINHLCNSDLISLKRKRRSAPRYGSRGNKRSVSIDKSVTVVPIPSRTEYSCQVREKIWSSSEELFANAARNSVEFASEGWNWRQAVEDEEMIVHKPSGELIHPIHLHNALACINQEEQTDRAVAMPDGK